VLNAIDASNADRIAVASHEAQAAANSIQQIDADLNGHWTALQSATAGRQSPECLTAWPSIRRNSGRSRGRSEPVRNRGARGRLRSVRDQRGGRRRERAMAQLFEIAAHG
jgi:hypothetical protein